MLRKILSRVIICVAFAPFLNPLSAANISSKPITANWLLASTWVGGIAPTQNDVAIIVSGANITING